MRQLVVHLLAVTQQLTEQIQTLEVRIGTLKACMHQRLSNSDVPARLILPKGQLRG